MYRKESVAYSREVDLSVNAQNLTRKTDTFILIISGTIHPRPPETAGLCVSCSVLEEVAEPAGWSNFYFGCSSHDSTIQYVVWYYNAPPRPPPPPPVR